MSHAVVPVSGGWMVAVPAAHAGPARPQDLVAFRAGRLWRFFTAQDAAYWAMVLYLVIEYVRPQQWMGPLEGLPLGQLCLGWALLARFISGRGIGIKGLGSWLMLLLTLIIVVSAFNAYQPKVAFENWRLWVNWVLVFYLIVNTVNTESRMVFYSIIWMLCHYYMSQGGAKQFAFRGFTFTNWGIVGAPGWFQNSSEFGIAMCMLLAVSWPFWLAARPYLTKWRKVFVIGMPITATLGIMGSSSRGAMLGLAAWAGWRMITGKNKIKSFAIVGTASVAIWFLTPADFRARFDTAGEDKTSEQRLIYWRNGMDMARENIVLGVGYKNWLPYYEVHYRDMHAAAEGEAEGRIQLAHNSFIECAAELGMVGFSVYMAMIVGTLVMNYRTRKRALAAHPPNEIAYQLAHGLDGAMIVFLVCGFFVTVFYYPFFWVNLALTTALSLVVRKPGAHSRSVPAAQRPSLARP